MIAVMMKDKKFYQILRTDGSPVCILSTRDTEFIFDSDKECYPDKLWRRAPNAAPKAIIDKWSKIAYPLSIKTFLHLGAKKIKIINEDL